MDDSNPNNRPAAEICGECGWDQAGDPVHLMASHRRVVVAAIILAIAAAIAFWHYRGEHSSPTVSAAYMYPQLVMPGFTREDLMRIVEDPGASEEGERLAAALQTAVSRDVLTWPGRRAVAVGFAPPPTRRSAWWRGGWPVTLLSRSQTLVYEDAVARSGFQPASTDPTAAPLTLNQMAPDPLRIPPRPSWVWRGDRIQYQPPPEKTGGVDTVYAIRWAALAAPLGILVVVGWTARGAVRVIGRLRKRRVESRRVVWIATAMTAVVFIGLTAWTASASSGGLSVFPQTNMRTLPGGGSTFAREGFEQLTDDRRSLQRRLREADAGRKVAAEILKVAPVLEGDHRRMYLGLSLDPEVEFTGQDTVWRQAVPLLRVLSARYTRRADFGPTDEILPERAVTVRYSRPDVNVMLSPGQSGGPTLNAIINIELLGAAILLLWFAGLVVRLLMRGVQRRTLARQRRDRCCVRCRYPLGDKAPAENPP